jgi:hypothetical protein
MLFACCCSMMLSSDALNFSFFNCNLICISHTLARLTNNLFDGSSHNATTFSDKS